MKDSGRKPRLDGAFKELRENWNIFTFYERFEQIVALILTAAIAVVIVAALIRLLRNIYSFPVLGVLDPTDYEVFQTIFGMIMTLLIAMEFKHSILRVVARRDSIVQVKTVVLIAMLALSRKFIIIDVKTTSPGTLAALAFSIIGLGIVYWLMRGSDSPLNDRNTEEP